MKSLGLLLLTALSISSASAQDAKQLLLEAVKAGAIEGGGAAPFRLKATYDTFDYLGRPSSSGTLEETFIKPGFRTEKLSEGHSSDKYAPDDPVATISDQPVQGGYMDQLVTNALLYPGPSLQRIDEGSATAKPRKFGNLELNCVSFTVALAHGTPPPAPKGVNLKPVVDSKLYCLDEKAPLLRTAELPFGMVAVYNKFVKFGGRTFSEEVTIQQRGRVRAKISVVSMQPAPELKEADFQPDAKPEQRLDLPDLRAATPVNGGVMAGKLLNKVAPTYPLEAKQKHQSGSVILRAIIGKDGHIQNLEVMSAPAESLAEAALEAVGQWTYTPFLLNGVPTEVDTTITVNFNFG